MMGSPGVSDNSIKTSPLTREGKTKMTWIKTDSIGDKPWYRSRTIITGIVMAIVTVLDLFGIPIPDAVIEGMLALLIIFLRLGNGSKIVKKFTK